MNKPPVAFEFQAERGSVTQRLRQHEGSKPSFETLEV